MDYLKLGLVITPDFITLEEEKAIMSNFDKRKFKGGKSRNTIKRYGSDAPYKSNMESKTVPPYLNVLSDRLVEKGLLNVKPDSVTVNEYLVGQGIAAHIDSVASGKVITVLSLLGSAQMVFQKGKESFSIDFPPRYVVQLTGEIRDKWQHSVPLVSEPRYSIVFRCSR